MSTPQPIEQMPHVDGTQRSTREPSSVCEKHVPGMPGFRSKTSAAEPCGPCRCPCSSRSNNIPTDDDQRSNAANHFRAPYAREVHHAFAGAPLLSRATKTEAEYKVSRPAEFDPLVILGVRLDMHEFRSRRDRSLRQRPVRRMGTWTELRDPHTEEVRLADDRTRFPSPRSCRADSCSTRRDNGRKQYLSAAPERRRSFPRDFGARSALRDRNVSDSSGGRAPF
jgi:hypothetical protein